MFLFFEMELPNNLPNGYPILKNNTSNYAFMAVPFEDGPPGENEPAQPEIQQSEPNEFSQVPQTDEDWETAEEIPPQDPDTMQMQQPPVDPQANQQFQTEIEPLKKIYLLQKLSNLNFVLKKNFRMDTDLSLLLKYGSYLSYNTLQTLAQSVVAGLQQQTQEMQQQSLQQQQEQPANVQV